MLDQQCWSTVWKFFHEVLLCFNEVHLSAVMFLWTSLLFASTCILIRCKDFFIWSYFVGRSCNVVKFIFPRHVYCYTARSQTWSNGNALLHLCPDSCWIGPVSFLATWRKRTLNQALVQFALVGIHVIGFLVWLFRLFVLLLIVVMCWCSFVNIRRWHDIAWEIYMFCTSQELANEDPICQFFLCCCSVLFSGLLNLPYLVLMAVFCTISECIEDWFQFYFLIVWLELSRSQRSRWSRSCLKWRQQWTRRTRRRLRSRKSWLKRRTNWTHMRIPPRTTLLKPSTGRKRYLSTTHSRSVSTLFP